MRLQLFLAKAGIASRRHAEQLILDGHVQVNKRAITQLGTHVDPNVDEVRVHGKVVRSEPLVYVLLNKPKGYVTTVSDPENRPTVFSLLTTPYQGHAEAPRPVSQPAPTLPKARLFPVGRLDYNTEGAIILTNDGLLAHRLMHPSHGVEKTYHAKMEGHLRHDQLQALRQGVVLPPAREFHPTEKREHTKRPVAPKKVERSAPADVRVLATTSKHTWLEIILHEGKNRQIHRMAEGIGSSLLKLARVQYAFLSVLDMPVGTFRKMQPDEVENLYQLAGLDRRIGHDAIARPDKSLSRPKTAHPRKGAIPHIKENKYRSRNSSRIGKQKSPSVNSKESNEKNELAKYSRPSAHRSNTSTDVGHPRKRRMNTDSHPPIRTERSQRRPSSEKSTSSSMKPLRTNSRRFGS